MKQAGGRETGVTNPIAVLGLSMLVGFALPGMQGCHSTAGDEAALPASIAERIAAIEKKAAPAASSRLPAEWERLVDDPRYVAARRTAFAKEVAARDRLTAAISLSPEERRKFLAILDTARERRLGAIDTYLRGGAPDSTEPGKPGADAVRGAWPVQTTRELKKLLGERRYREYLTLVGNTEPPQRTGGLAGQVRYVTEDTELTADTDRPIFIAADNVTLNCNHHVIMNGAVDGPGIEIRNRKNVTIRNCIVLHFDIGVLTANSTGTTVARSRALGGLGFRIENSTNTDMVSNTGTENAAEGFVIRNSVFTFFYGNAGVENTRDGFDENGGMDAYYLENQASHNGLNGMELDFASNPTYWENQAVGNGQHGLSVDSTNSALLHGNDTPGNGEDGLRLDDEVNNANVNIGTTNSAVRYNASAGNGRWSAHQCGDLCIGNVFIGNDFSGPTNNIP